MYLFFRNTPRYGLPSLRCATEIDGSRSERGYDIVEPTAHGLFTFQHIHRSNYHFELVKLAGHGPNHVTHFPQPLA